MGIELVKVRATIQVGGLVVKTPYILSFSVRKARNQRSTFDASLKVPYTQLSGNNTGGDVIVSAGTEANEIVIFTGILKTITLTPCWEDPGYTIMNVGGVDVLYKLENKKYTRRTRATKSSWVTIDKVEREGLRSSKFSFDLGVLGVTPDSMLPTIMNSGVKELISLAKAVFTDSAEPVPIVLVTFKARNDIDNEAS